MAKNGQVHAGRKVGRSSATHIKLSVDFVDLKFMSFEFGNVVFMTFDIPRSSLQMIFCEKTFHCSSVHL